MHYDQELGCSHSGSLQLDVFPVCTNIGPFMDAAAYILSKHMYSYVGNYHVK